MKNFLLPLLLLQLPLSSLGDHGVYKPMLKGNLRRFAIKTASNATLAPEKEIKNLYDEVDFDESDVSSPWLANYIRWHHQARSLPESKYLVVEPGRGDTLTSQLKHLPYYLMLAAQYQRVLVLTNWDLSSLGDVCGLHDFLQPSLLDWTLPQEDLLEDAVNVMADTDMNHFNRLVSDRIMEGHQDTQTLLVHGTQLSYILGLDRVFSYSNKDPMVFKYIYKYLFRLTEPVQQMVDDTKMSMMDQDYLGLHIRLPGVYGQLYRSYLQGPVLEDPHAYENIEQKMLEVGNQALERVQHVVNGDRPLVAYVGGDTVETMTLLREDHSDDMDNIAIFEDAVAFAHSGNLDDCSRFYHELVDLYVLAEANCIVFGDDAIGEVATLMNGFECWSTYEHNTMIASMGGKSPFAHNQAPIVPGSNVATPLANKDNSIAQTS